MQATRVLRLVLAFALVTTFGSPTWAICATSRGVRHFGVSVSALGDPHPSLVGINLNYNLGSLFRISAGYGVIGQLSQPMSATSVGGALKMFVPGWNLSPFLGLGYTHFTLSGELSSILGVTGFNSSGDYPYLTTGIDLQTVGGFNIGFGVNRAFIESPTMTPFGYLGWYF